MVQSDWFDIDMSKMDAYNQRYIENLKKTNSFDKWFKSISEKSFRRYPKLNKVAARDNGTLVGFFIWAYTTPYEEGITKFEKIDITKKIPVIISVAVNPNYRNRGLYSNMFDKSGIKGDYLVQASSVLSPMEFWTKKGCEVANNIGGQNMILYCKANI